MIGIDDAGTDDADTADSSGDADTADSSDDADTADSSDDADTADTGLHALARVRPALAFAAVVLAASVVPIPGGSAGGSAAVPIAGIGPTDPFHLLGYAVLAGLTARSTGRGLRGLAVAAAVATGFGFGIELLQTAIPWRTFAWRDVAVNAVGAILGVAVSWGFTRRRLADFDAFRRSP
ncbi:VanZ family protein [Halorubrum sp. DTA98]|uniref:VanZ family protein n=1 Tax=Halorubrum sp. DTA98 TaxID=3402163 RepID=UPI003AABA617